MQRRLCITTHSLTSLKNNNDNENNAGFMPYTKIAPERLKPGHKGDLAYLVGKKVKVRVVQVRVEK